MANVRFGNIDRTPKATGKSVWGWYTEPERVTEEKRRARTMAESLAAAHEVIQLRGGIDVGKERIEKRPKCFGSMFRENGTLRYGAMVCDEEFCEHSKECWGKSKGNVPDKVLEEN